MAKKSKRIEFYDPVKIEKINPENMRLLDKYKIDMAIRELAESTQYAYIINLYQWFIYILDRQKNRSVLEMEDDDITEFLYFCKNEGNNTARMKVRISVISTLLKNAGMSLEDVSVLLNHESTDTTKRFYIKQDTARINDIKGRYNI